LIDETSIRQSPGLIEQPTMARVLSAGGQTGVSSQLSDDQVEALVFGEVLENP
jgi:hypothetical protein